MSYRRHYDDSFLDGLHNYLPEILYGQPEQFGSAAPLVSYIQSQMQQRFDLFSAGHRSFVPTSTLATPPRQIPQPPNIQRIPIDISELYNISPLNRTNVIDSYTINLIQSLFPGRVPTQNIMEPVIVHPTLEQITAGSTIDIVDAEEEMCAICQDSMPPGSVARSLNACDHRFHTGCIDTWFLRDVRCPTCRHDIRLPANPL